MCNDIAIVRLLIVCGKSGIRKFCGADVRVNFFEVYHL
jgi:hypothetical protein